MPHVPNFAVHGRDCRPTPLGPKRNPPGPVVIWNLIRRCNLTCKHCYSISADTNFPGELSTEQVYAVMDDLKGFKVPVLILSGGEPLLRPDIYDIAKRAKAKGFYVGLSSNGTLIDENNIAKIAECDFNYVGVSLDGIRETHDKFRRLDGAFEASLKGIRLCRDLGLKIGVRFTMTQDNAHDLPALLKLVEDEGIDRFYFSHLNYAGRGNKNRKDDAQHQLTRWAVDLLFDTCWDYQQRGLEKEFHHRQQRCRRRLFPALGASPFSRQRGTRRSQAAPVGRQFLGRQCRQHRYPRNVASRHHVVASHAGQRQGSAVLANLAGYLGCADGWPQAPPARRRRALRHLRLSGGLQRQHARSRPATDWQPVG